MKEDWKDISLKEACDLFTDGDWIETKNQSSEGIRLIQTGNIGSGKFKNRKSKARYISEETFQELNCTEVFPGDLLVSRLPDPVGRSCLIPDIGAKMITAVDCTIIRPKKDLLNPEYLMYYQMSRGYYNNVYLRVTGTTRSRISRKNLGMLNIPIPPLPEQKRIVAILDQAFEAIDKALENVERNIDNAEELFQSKLNEIFSQRGEEWEEKRLDEVCENLDRMREPISKKNREDGPYPYYGASGIVDYVADYIFDEDLLLVSEDGANLLARTYPIAFSISDKNWVNNHAHVLRFDNMASQRFIEYYLNSIKLDPWVSGMAQPKLNQRNLNSIPVPFSSKEEQKRIVEGLDILKKNIESIKKVYNVKAKALNELKKSILQKAFSGELTANEHVAV